jgi:4-diphosphocytidyl-2-C-methyl-D-erythritol kinase
MLIRREVPPQADSVQLIPGQDLSRVRVLAPAKINLHLEILGQRPDGYHAIETLMVAVDLCDELIFEDSADAEVRLRCDDPNLTVGPENLILRAAFLLRKELGVALGAAIGLAKRIPWAAGLGGGSSDAAATLAGLNELWRLGLSSDRLKDLASRLGSDVPFFFDAPAAFGVGRGEITTPAPIGRTLDLVLVMPPFGLNTAEVYRERRQAGGAVERKDPGPALKALADGDVEALGRLLHNRLQEPAARVAPMMARLGHRLGSLGAAGWLMTGSGSCLFALCRDEREAARVAHDLRSGWPSHDELARTRVFTVKSCS